MKCNLDMIMAAVQLDGRALKHDSDEVKSNVEIGEAALQARDCPSTYFFRD